MLEIARKTWQYEAFLGGPVGFDAAPEDWFYLPLAVRCYGILVKAILKQESLAYPFRVGMDMCMGFCSTLRLERGLGPLPAFTWTL
jgi:hypothetical protein